MEKRFPVLFESKEKCCGCSACLAACPVDAISMKRDEEGFEYPSVDEEKCVGCQTCLSVCVFKRDQKEKGLMQ